jgi:hypothetical protein
MKPDTQIYSSLPGRVYNLESTDVIRTPSDIAHREVAHAFWAAVLAEPLVTCRTAKRGILVPFSDQGEGDEEEGGISEAPCFVEISPQGLSPTSSIQL